MARAKAGAHADRGRERGAPRRRERALVLGVLLEARALGVGVVVATQNPMDLDYRARLDAGLWCLGRLQTDADRARVIDGLSAAPGTDTAGLEELAATLQRSGNGRETTSYQYKLASQTELLGCDEIALQRAGVLLVRLE